jgi:hypothetical protein
MEKSRPAPQRAERQGALLEHAEHHPLLAAVVVVALCAAAAGGSSRSTAGFLLELDATRSAVPGCVLRRS